MIVNRIMRAFSNNEFEYFSEIYVSDGDGKF